MSDFPELNICTPTHEAIVTFEGQEPRKIYVTESSNYQAFMAVLRQLFGDDRDQVMPPMILSVKRVNE